MGGEASSPGWVGSPPGWHLAELLETSGASPAGSRGATVQREEALVAKC